MNLMARSAQLFMASKAARAYLDEILPSREKDQEKFYKELDDLLVLATAGKSIFQTYIDGCSDLKKKTMREEFAGLLKLGLTIDMILEKAASIQPEIKPIMEAMPAYRQAETERIMAFLRGG